MTNDLILTMLNNIDEKLDRLLEDHVHEEITLDINTTTDMGRREIEPIRPIPGQLPLFPGILPDLDLNYDDRYTCKEFAKSRNLNVDRRVLGIFASRVGHLKNIREDHKQLEGMSHALKTWPLTVWEDALDDYNQAIVTERKSV